VLRFVVESALVLTPVLRNTAISLLATAKANGIDPHRWLSETLARLPTTLNRDINTLLPLRRD
jgi:glucan phosphorylase